MSLFFIGILEMLIVTAWTKTVSNNQVWLSGMITFVNILIWYYVLEKIITDISNIRLILLYALGCALGTIAVALYFSHQEKRKEPRLQNEFTAA